MAGPVTETFRNDCPLLLCDGGGLSCALSLPHCWLEGRCTSSLLQAKHLTTTQHVKRRQPSSAPHAKRQATKQQAKPRQPPPPQFTRHGAHTKPPQTFHHPNTKPPSNTLNRDSPPRHSSLGTGRTRNPRNTPTEPGGIPRTPEPQTRRGIDIPRRDIRVSEAKRGRVPCRSKGNIYTSSQNL